MSLLSDYPPFVSVLWTMAVFFAWIIWFWLLITIFSDLFRRDDLGGMAERSVKQQQAAQQQLDDRIRSAAPSGAAADIEKAKQLLDSGAITQAEYDALKAKALAM